MKSKITVENKELNNLIEHSVKLSLLKLLLKILKFSDILNMFSTISKTKILVFAMTLGIAIVILKIISVGKNLKIKY